MKMKLAKIASQPFHASMKNLMKASQVPVKSMMATRCIAKVVASETEKYNEVYTAIAEEFGLRDEDNKLVLTGNSIKIQPDKIKEMDIKLKEVATIEVDIQEIRYSDLGPNPSINAEDLYQLEFIVE